MGIRDMKLNLPPKDKLSEAVKRLQYVKGVSNVELAKMLGVSLMTVVNIRNGVTSYERMAQAFHELEKIKLR